MVLEDIDGNAFCALHVLGVLVRYDVLGDLDRYIYVYAHTAVCTCMAFVHDYHMYVHGVHVCAYLLVMKLTHPFSAGVLMVNVPAVKSPNHRAEEVRRPGDVNLSRMDQAQV